MSDLKSIFFGTKDLPIEDNDVARKCQNNFFLYKDTEGCYYIKINNAFTTFYVKFLNSKEALDNIEKIILNFYESKNNEDKSLLPKSISSVNKNYIEVMKLYNKNKSELVDLISKLSQLCGEQTHEIINKIQSAEPIDHLIEYELSHRMYKKINSDDGWELLEKISVLISNLKDIQKRLKKESYIIRPDELRLNDNELINVRKKATELLEKTKRNIDGEEVYDLSTINDITTRDYLLEVLYNKNMKITDDQFKAILFYKNGNFSAVNSILRGSIESINKNITTPDELKEVVNVIMTLHELFQSIPKCPKNILIGRNDNGFLQEIEQDKRNIMWNFVSFSTNNGVLIGKNDSIHHYKRILRKGESAIPVELFSQLRHHDSENEILLEPFSYIVKDAKKEDEIINVTMKSIYSIPVYESLFNGLNKYKKYLEEELIKCQNAEEKDKIYSFLQSTNESIDVLREREYNPKIIPVQTSPLIFFDDIPEPLEIKNSTSTNILSLLKNKKTLLKEKIKDKKKVSKH